MPSKSVARALPGLAVAVLLLFLGLAPTSAQTPPASGGPVRYSSGMIFLLIIPVHFAYNVVWLLFEGNWENPPLLAQFFPLFLLGALFGIIFAIPVSFLAARNLMSGSWLTMGVYYAVRTIMNIIRAIEPLIWALIAVQRWRKRTATQLTESKP